GTGLWLPAAVAPVVDLAAIAAQCPDQVPIESCYAAWDALGMVYGPAHRGLEQVAVGRDANAQRVVLARVALPACVQAGASAHGLHPSVLDSALHAGIALSLEASGAGTPRLPFSLDDLTVFGPSSQVAWAVVRVAPTTTATVRKLDVD